MAPHDMCGTHIGETTVGDVVGGGQGEVEAWDAVDQVLLEGTSAGTPGLGGLGDRPGRHRPLGRHGRRFAETAQVDGEVEIAQ